MEHQDLEKLAKDLDSYKRFYNEVLGCLPMCKTDVLLFPTEALAVFAYGEWRRRMDEIAEFNDQLNDLEDRINEFEKQI